MTERQPITQRLLEFYAPDEADAWLFAPHPQLDMQTPAFAVDQGAEDDVHAIIDRMEGGSFL